jgi:hypothetical protein
MNEQDIIKSYTLFIYFCVLVIQHVYHHLVKFLRVQFPDEFNVAAFAFYGSAFPCLLLEEKITKD